MFGRSLQDIYETLVRVLKILGIIFLIFIPLGVWKAIELIIEFLSHVSWK